MTESKLPKPNPQIIWNLNSPNPDLVIETIGQLRDSGNISYIPALIELLHSSKTPEIKVKITNLLADIKHGEIIPYLLDAIQNEKYLNERKQLVSVCWENGLDFSSALPVFVDLLIGEELELAFEAYSVIINMEGKISAEMLDSETGKMETALLQADEQKKQLLAEIIGFLPKLSDE
ncbi:MAG: HEAT repeat domain-containing protein [Prolixibacteraceae bacterium]|jgi:hypothetical protein|nr:HEAT repeat domain-containing protein [Prolixibacteraceae bacterium]